MGALGHLGVVEVGSYIMGPFCARLFADLGASVTKVEPPDGDPSRASGPFSCDRPDAEQSGLFHYLNAGKRGVIGDLDEPEALELLHQLLAGADVLVENTSAHERARWELDFDSLLARHPHLVIVSLSPYGRTGPWADRPGSDITMQAASSLAFGLGLPDADPLRIPYDQAEYQTAFHGMAAALVALVERESSGRGQGIDISGSQVMSYQVGGMHLVTKPSGQPWARAGTRLKGAIFPTGLYQCKDGFMAIVSQHARQWRTFIELMGDPEWAQQDSARDSLYLGRAEEEPAHLHFANWVRAHTREELMELARANNIIMGKVQSVDELASAEQLAFRNAWGEVDLAGQDVRLPKPGYQLSKTPTRISARGPALAPPDENDRPSAPPVQGREALRNAPLHGVRVLDFGWNWAGPMAGQLLADCGAEVIRLETRKRQDNMRLPRYSSFFCHNNRSKLSATFNIADPRGAALVRTLATKSDIVMNNFAAGVMDKNGLSYEALCKENPEVIAVSMSMAGQQGPASWMRGFAAIATGFAGLEGMVGYPEAGVTTGMLPFGLGDTTMAIQGFIGALAALVHRQRTGEGQFVDVSQIESTTATMGEALLDYQLNGRVAGVQGNRHPAFAPHGLYPTVGDDRWLAIAVRDEREWLALCEVVGWDQWAIDEQLLKGPGRKAREQEIETALTAWCSAQDRDEAAAMLCEAGVPAAPLLEAPERDRHPALTTRGFSVQHDFDGRTPCEIYATPWLLSATPAAVRGPTPDLGEHNDYVYRELLALSDDEIVQLKADGVLE